MVKPNEVTKYLNIGRDKTYALLKIKGFPSIKIGNQYLVPEDKLNKWIDSKMGKQIFVQLKWLKHNKRIFSSIKSNI